MYSSSQRSAARVLPFVSSPEPITMSLEDRLAQLREVDPEGAAMIERIFNAICARVERG